jgi:hypothetical protein
MKPPGRYVSLCTGTPQRASPLRAAGTNRYARVPSDANAGADPVPIDIIRVANYHVGQFGGAPIGFMLCVDVLCHLPYMVRTMRRLPASAVTG